MFDWINITYANAGDCQEPYVVAAQVKIWISFKDKTQNNHLRVFAIIHSLDKYQTPNYQFCPAWKGDTLFKHIDIQEYDMIYGVASLLPAVPPGNELLRTMANTCIHDNAKLHDYFVSLPQRSDWSVLKK